MLRWLHRLEDSCLIILVSLLVLLPLLQISSRSLGLTTPLWIDQSVRLLVLWLAMAGAMLASRDNSHIRIDILDRLVQPRLAGRLTRCGHLIAAGCCATLAWQTGKLTWIDYQDGVDAFLQLPLWLCELIIPLSFAVMALRFGLLALERNRC